MDFNESSLVVHVELFVVNEGAARELGGQPSHQLAGLVLVDIDEGALCQDQCGAGVGDFALCQLPLQGWQVGEVGGDQVVPGQAGQTLSGLDWTDLVL